MNKIISVLLLSTLLISGCYIGSDDYDSDRIQQKQTERLMSEVQRQIGLPNIRNFQQKKIMKMIYEETDKENLICYAYIVAKYSGKLIFLGKCVGYGVPFSAQYTNPVKVKRYSISVTSQKTQVITVPQADPNGLFMPTTSSATWLMLIDPKSGKPRPVYIEPEIIVSPFPINCN